MYQTRFRGQNFHISFKETIWNFDSDILGDLVNVNGRSQPMRSIEIVLKAWQSYTSVSSLQGPILHSMCNSELCDCIESHMGQLRPRHRWISLSLSLYMYVVHSNIQMTTFSNSRTQHASILSMAKTWRHTGAVRIMASRDIVVCIPLCARFSTAHSTSYEVSPWSRFSTAHSTSHAQPLLPDES